MTNQGNYSIVLLRKPLRDYFLVWSERLPWSYLKVEINYQHTMKMLTMYCLMYLLSLFDNYFLREVYYDPDVDWIQHIWT